MKRDTYLGIQFARLSEQFGRDETALHRIKSALIDVCKREHCGIDVVASMAGVLSLDYDDNETRANYIARSRRESVRERAKRTGERRMILKIGAAQYDVADLRAATALWAKRRDEEGYGASDMPTVKVYDGRRWLRAAYNGRLFIGKDLVFDPSEAR